MSLAEVARELALKSREMLASNPLDLFRDDMIRAAKQGLFSVDIHLNAQHGPSSFFRSPDVQDMIGDALSDEGIKVSFGEPSKLEGYPSLRLDWFSTRRVVKWSRVVRQEKSATHYGLGVDQLKSSKKNKQLQQQQQLVDRVESDDDDDDNNNENVEGGDSRVYEEKAVAGGVKFDSEAVADAIRNRRKEQKVSRDASRDEAIKTKKQREEEMIAKSVDAVVARAQEIK